MKKCKDFNDMIDYITERIIEEEDLTCVLSAKTTVSVLNELREYIDYCVDNFISEVKDYEVENAVFMLTKIENQDTEEITLIIELLYQDSHDELKAGIKDVYGKVVILEKGLISDKNKELIEFDDELIEVCVNIEESPEIEQLKLYAEIVSNLGCKECVLEVLVDLYNFAYNEGSKDELIRINNTIVGELVKREDY